MNPAARSVNVFGTYLVVLGIGLLAVPNALLPVLRLPLTSEVWIRVVGMLVAFLGIYYRVAAAADLRVFFLATVMVRASVPVILLTFVFAGWVEWPLLLLGFVDAAGAAWTWSALRGGPLGARPS